MVEHTRLTNVSFMSSRLHSRIPSIYARSFSCLYKVTHAQCAKGRNIIRVRRIRNDTDGARPTLRMRIPAYWSDKGNYDFRRD